MDNRDYDERLHSGAGLLDPPEPPTLQHPAEVVQPSGDVRVPFVYTPPASRAPMILANPNDTAQPTQAAPAQPAGRWQSNPATWALIIIGAIVMLGLGYLLAAVLIGSILFNRVAVQPVGELRVDTQSIQLGAAKSADVSLNMNAGNISLAGGGSNLADASFTYNVSQWKPVVNYSVSGDTGALVIRQPKTDLSTDGRARNDWDLRLKNDVPTTLDINLGAGNMDLNLGGLSLTKMNVDNLAGNTSIDLTGAWKNNLDATFTGLAGNTTLRLPSDVGVLVRAKAGLGQVVASGLKANGDVYTNDAYGKSPYTLNINATVQVGQLILQVVK